MEEAFSGHNNFDMAELGGRRTEGFPRHVREDHHAMLTARWFTEVEELAFNAHESACEDRIWRELAVSLLCMLQEGVEIGDRAVGEPRNFFGDFDNGCHDFDLGAIIPVRLTLFSEESSEPFMVGTRGGTTAIEPLEA
jgi:hypothetical protein